MSSKFRLKKPIIAVGTGIALIAVGIFGWTHVFSRDQSAFQHPVSQTSIQVPGGSHPGEASFYAGRSGQNSYAQSVYIGLNATRIFANQPIVFSMEAGDGALANGNQAPPVLVRWQWPQGSRVRALTPLVITPYSTALPPFPSIAQITTRLQPSTNSLNQSFDITALDESASWAVTLPRGTSRIPVSVKLLNGWHRFTVPVSTISVPFKIHTQFTGLHLQKGVANAQFAFRGQYQQARVPKLPSGNIIYRLSGTATGLKPQTKTLPSSEYTQRWVSFSVPMTPTSRGTVIQTIAPSTPTLISVLSGYSNPNWTYEVSAFTADQIAARYTYARLGIDWSKLFLRDWYWLLIALAGLIAVIKGWVEFKARRDAEALKSSIGFSYRDQSQAPEDRHR